MVAGAVDIAMFRKATLDDVRLFREAVMEIDEEDDEDEKCEKENDEYWSDRILIKARDVARSSAQNSLSGKE
uniref:Uncharacterized protein n=1 Tax=Zea mays TaxID=4577 RepID=A0A804P490_MAIZE